MHRYGCHSEAGITLVGDEGEATRVRAYKVCASDSGLCLHIFRPEVNACLASNGFRIVVVFFTNTLAQKCFGNVSAVKVDDRLDDVRWLVAIKLDYEFTEVGFKTLNTIFYQEWI